MSMMRHHAMLIGRFAYARKLFYNATHHTHSLAHRRTINPVKHYLCRAKVIDSIRLSLRTGNPDSLLPLLNERNLDSFVVVNALRSAPSPDSALSFLDFLKRIPHFSHTQHTLHAIAKILAKSGHTAHLRKLIDAIHDGLFKKVAPISFMDRMRWFAIAGDLDSVLCAWDEYRAKGKRPCTESYNIVMSVYVQRRKDLDAVQTFSRLVQEGAIPNSRTYTVMIEHLLDSGNIDSAKKVFDMLPSMRVKRTLKQYSLLVDAFSGCERFDVVKSVLADMQTEGVLPKRSMLPSLQRMHESGFVEETDDFIKEMMADDRIKKIEPCTGDSEDEGEEDDEQLGDSEEHGVQLKPWLDPCALASALRDWRPEDVSALEDANFVWTSRLVCKMIRHFKSSETAWQFFCWVACQPGFTHDVHTVSRMITKLARCGNADLVDRLIAKTKDEGFKLAFSTIRMIIDFYGLAKSGQAALKVFRDVKGLCGPISASCMSLLYSSLLRTLTKCGSGSEAIDIVEEMLLVEIQPDIQTLCGLMHHFASKGDFKTVRRLFGIVRQSRLEPDAYMYKILIHAYCKAGRATLALRLFEDMRSARLMPDVATKSLLVKSLWKEGRLRESAMVEESCEGINDTLPLALPGHIFTVSCSDLAAVQSIYCASFSGI